ncbi:MAG: hypothetical protein ABJC79_15665 [Acidimicrobiia bacterium]
MQGVVRSFDPGTGEGVVVTTNAERSEVLLASNALEGSIFRMLRQGQRVNFDLDASGNATAVRSGAEKDMALPPDIQV